MSGKGFLRSLLIVVGLCLSGSDGVWWPWANIVGLVLFATGAMSLGGD